tara:strand:+ start:442 stop:621 length:180 start_codon:yes stop_codon:yes gene_type:complete
VSQTPFRYFKTSSEIIPLPLRNVEDPLYEHALIFATKWSATGATSSEISLLIRIRLTAR